MENTFMGRECGSFDTVTNYYSYKFQCLVTLMGHCVHVSNAERAGSHDMVIYRKNRTEMLNWFGRV